MPHVGQVQVAEGDGSLFDPRERARQERVVRVRPDVFVVGLRIGVHDEQPSRAFAEP